MTGNSTPDRRRPKAPLVVALAALAILVIGGAIVLGVNQMAGNPSDAPRSSAGEASPTQTQGPDAGGTDEDGGSPSEGTDEGEDEADVQIGTNKVLPRPMGGQEAIDELGDNIQFVAERNGKSVDELKEFLLRNESAQVSPNGFISIP